MLSQYEIDAILNSLSTPAESEKQSSPAKGTRTKLYDFRRPDKFSKENLRTLRMVHETFSRTFSSALSSYLRAGVQIHLSSVEQLVYDEYIQQLPDPTLISVINLAPLPGRALFEVNLDIAYVMLDRLLGGSGVGPARTRELTDIEYSLFRNLTGYFLGAYREAWASIVPLAPELDDIVLNPQFVQAALPGDMAVFVLLEAKILEKSGTITICIPHTVLEPIMDRLRAQTYFTSSRRASTATARPELEGQLGKVKLDMAVELGKASLTFRELLDLRAGDVIRLEAGLEDELLVRVEGRPKHLCRPGVIGRSMGVQITKTLEEGEYQSNG
jgi:flagellar motor switch protein FliM